MSVQLASSRPMHRVRTVAFALLSVIAGAPAADAEADSASMRGATELRNYGTT